MTDPRLGRRAIPDDKHLRAGFALSDDTLPAEPTPVVVGTNWFTAFFKDGLVERRGPRGEKEYWLPEQNLGRVEGGHAYCFAPLGVKDSWHDWVRFDQIGGSCVGFSTARYLWWAWRRTVDPYDIYLSAQLRDPWADTPPAEGTDVRSAFDYLREGPPLLANGKRAPADLQVQVNRWARDVRDVHSCLKDEARATRGCARFTNSWGHDGYPHWVHVSDELLDRLLFREGGEAVVVVEK